MRILSLHIDRFGTFTDRRLDFDEDKPLTVVHGPNEAGKSTALVALTEALFGIDVRSPFNFLHDYASLRIGATLRTADGRTLAFRRRKGARQTLLDAADQPIADDSLLPFLGRVDQALFREAFALDQVRLRKGGEQLRAGEGSLGEALLAAAPGLGRLVELRRSTADAAGALFEPGRRDQRKALYAAAQRWEDARRLVRERSLSADALEKARRARDDAAATAAALEADRRALRTEDERRKRLAAARVPIATLDQLRGELAACADAPALPDGFEDDRDRLDRAIAAAETALRLLADQRDERRFALQALAPRADLLAEAAAIDRLVADRRIREAADRERPGLLARLREAEDTLAERARDLGFPGVSDLLAARPSIADGTRLRALVRSGRDLAARLAAASGTVEGLTRRLDSLAAETPARDLRDPAPLRASLEIVAGLDSALQARAARGAERDQIAARLEAAIAAAGLSGPPAALRRRHLPPRTVVEAAERAEADAARRLDLAAERHAAALARWEAVRPDPDGEDRDGVSVTDEALAAARTLRASAWGEARAILFGEREAAPPERFAAARRVEEATADADRIADHRLAAADRLAALAQRRRERDAAAEALRTAEADLQAARAAGAEAASAWAARIVDTDCAGLSPRDARFALDRHDDLMLRLEALDRAELAAQSARADVDRLLETLRALAAEAAVRIDEADPLGTLARVRAAVTAIAEAFQAARDTARARGDAERALAEAEVDRDRLDADRQAWTAAWRDALAAVRLPADTGVDAAETALGAWAEVPEVVKARDTAARRLADLDADSIAFDREVDRLRPLLGPSAEGIRPADAALRLGELLAESRAQAARRTAIEGELEALEADIRERGVALSGRRAERARLLEAAGLRADADLAAAIALARRADALRTRIEDTRAGLLATAGRTEDEIRAELAGIDFDALAADGALAAERLEAIDRAHAEAVAAHATARDAYDRLAAEEGADAAGQEAENAMAAALGLAEEWQILQAANRLAGAVVEEFRRRHQSPVLAEATRLFAILTAGRYPALAADYDDDGRARLVVVREDGRRLDPDALSEGTLDQLYLALRLATLADHARRAEPLPFVGDDLFVTFDEARTRAGLMALADFGAVTQAILFTHHEHVVAIAEEALGPRAGIIRLG